MLADFKDFSPPVLQILSLMEKTDIWALFDHPPAHTYHRGGKICLLGDSAHASTPHHGAGAGMAIEDALVLSSLLRQISGGRQKGELERVFDVYDLVRRPRSQRLVGSSRRMGRVYDFEDESVGGDKRALRDYLAHAWEWIWGEDVEGMVERAVGLLRGRSDVD